jgi:two-component system response regulator HupR/HoxA
VKRYGLLIVDDENDILRALSLTFEEEYNVFTAPSGAKALEILEKEEIALIIADQRMPEMSGIEFLERTIEKYPRVIRIILTAYPDTASLLQAINAGQVYRYIVKPWDRAELKITVKRALESYELALENQRLLQELQAANEQLKAENLYLKREVERDSRFENIIGKSPAMERAFDLVDKVINSSVTVLLTGETGTGKGLLAHCIHSHGPRKGKLCIAQNCGALPDALLESELFGHRRGSFTGAVQDKKGLFEVADGGTIFLDEVSEMSPAMQVKLLQVLQEGTFRRIGETEYKRVDVRIISATNKDLEAEVKKGTFREDLYYRVSVFPIRVPPLRERRDDIPLLALHFLEKHRKKLSKQVVGFSQEAMELVCGYDFPGNVRELENLVERALALAGDNTAITPDLLPEKVQRNDRVWEAAGARRDTLKEATDRIERQMIIEALEKYAGNKTQAALALGLSRVGFQKMLKRHRLR